MTYRLLVRTERLLDDVLPDVPFRQWTFSLPEALRRRFVYDGSLYKELSQLVVRELTRYFRSVTGHPNLEPAFVVWDQSFGTLLDSFHPHQHICASDGGFLPDGTFVPLGRVRKKDVAAICQVLRRRVLRWLVRRDKLSPEFRDCMLGWEHSGFSLDASRRIPAGRRQRLEQLLNYMDRHPFNPKGIHYNATRQKVRYVASKRHARRHTNTIEVDAVDFIAIVAAHIPHRRRHQVRFYGAATPRVRKRLGLHGQPVSTDMPAVTAARGRKSWARLVWKLTGVDPLVCPNCGNDRVILAVIFDRASLRRIAIHQGLPTQLPVHRSARDPPPLTPSALTDQAARNLTAKAPDDNTNLFVDPDTSAWDAIDEPFESDTDALPHTTAPNPVPARPYRIDRAKHPDSLLDLLNRWPGVLRWADQLDKDRRTDN